LIEPSETAVGLSASEGRRPGVQPAGIGGYAFGRFVFYPQRQMLFNGETEVRLGSRAAAILTLLVQRAGEVVLKDEIMSAAWPSTSVDEVGLRVQVVALRKLLGESRENSVFILNVVGRGYRFAGEVYRVEHPPATISPRAIGNRSTSAIPSPLAKLVGRKEATDEVVALLSEQRLVTIVGPGGIGKTSVALAVAQLVPDLFEDGRVFVDLAAVSDGHLVPFAVAAAFNISAETIDPIGSLSAFLNDGKAYFVVLDNCEHVVDAAAHVAEALLRSSPNVKILATSHEPLRAAGERAFRINPLELPARADLCLRDALRYPAIELFVDRATSDNQSLMLGDEDVTFIAEICRKLDGIPLAIEIAAARVEAFGIGDLAERLDDRLDVPNAGRRTAVERHQTIRKMLDWSHDNLSGSEQVLLRRLSVFAAAFTLEAALMVAGDAHLGTFAMTEALAGLVRKSLLHPHTASRTISYRLLESTRIYALHRLMGADEVERMRRLHLQFVTDMMERAEADWTSTRRVVWIDRYAVLLDDARQALDWAFSPVGDDAAGVRLAALVMPLAMQIGLIDEFRERNDLAMERARKLAAPELVAEMRLNIYTAFLNTNQSQPLDGTMNGVERAKHLADLTGDDRYRTQPLFQLAGFKMGMGDYRAALDYAEKLNDLSHKIGDELAILGARRMLAQTSHFNGLHARTNELAEAVLASPVVNIPFAFGSVQVDRRVSMRIVMSRSLWLQGKSERALEVMREAVEIAPQYGPHALCHALSQAACPISLWCGDLGAVEDYSHRLIEESARFTLNHWNSWGHLYANAVKGSGGADPAYSIATQGDLQIHTLATINGQLDGIDLSGSDLIDRTGWAAPEILRRSGLTLLSTDEHAAEAAFSRSMGVAKLQGAVAWQLRAATSWAELIANRGEVQRAKDLVTGIYGRLTEGFSTADVMAAAEILSKLA
jgi:predicted ATPase/DNA-binding winged helix-turn-helix (wHTH) protein